MVLVNNFRTVLQVSILGRQLYPRKSKGYDKHGYFVVDMSPHDENKYHLRAYIFPNVDPIINEPVHEISNNVLCATSKVSDQPAHTRSLIRAFASRLSIL